jgi:pimeloyl-ACP methyl ester carboxylesterase
MNGRLQRWRVCIRILLALLALWMLPGASGWGAALGLFWMHGIVMALSFVVLLPINRTSPVLLMRAFPRELWLYERVFSFWQPFAERRVHDAPHPRADSRGVLLLHGYNCNRGLWNAWMTQFRRQGAGFMALSMEPVNGSIECYTPMIEDAVRRLTEATGKAPLVVAHSMGGLAARAWWRAHGQPGRVHAMVTIGTPHAGTPIAYLGWARNVREMRPGSDWLRELALCEQAKPLPPMTCYASACDQIVCPTASALLPGADCTELHGVGHLSLVFHPQVRADVMARLAG